MFLKDVKILYKSQTPQMQELEPTKNNDSLYHKIFN